MQTSSLTVVMVKYKLKSLKLVSRLLSLIKDIIVGSNTNNVAVYAKIV